ncbi:MAG: hypothetical protein AB7F40_11205 [Victivallaceae bacterium]|nr:hypothetical protein [Victivallaceae bacterium]
MKGFFQVRIATMPVVLLAAAFFCCPFNRWGMESAILVLPLLFLLPAATGFYCIDFFCPKQWLRRKCGGVTGDLIWCMVGSLLVSAGLAWPQFLGVPSILGVVMLLMTDDASGEYPTIKLTLYSVLGLFLVADYLGPDLMLAALPPLGMWSLAVVALLSVLGRWRELRFWWRPIFMVWIALLVVGGAFDWQIDTRGRAWFRPPPEEDITRSFGDIALATALPGGKDISMYYRGPLTPARRAVLGRMVENYIGSMAVETSSDRPQLGGKYDVVMLASTPDSEVACDLLLPRYAEMARDGFLILPADAPLTAAARTALADFKYAAPLEYPPQYMVYSNRPAVVTLDNFGTEYEKLFPGNPFVPAPVLQLLMREKLTLFPPAENYVSREFLPELRKWTAIRWWWLLPAMAVFFALRLFFGGGATAAQYFDGWEDGFYYGMIWGVLMSIGVASEITGNILPPALAMTVFITAIRIPGDGEPWRKYLGWLAFAFAPWWLPYGWLWTLGFMLWWRLNRRTTVLAAPAFLLLFPYYPMAALYGGSLALVSGILTYQCMRSPFERSENTFPASYNAMLCIGMFVGAWLALFGDCAYQLVWLVPALLFWRLPAAGRGK